MLKVNIKSSVEPIITTESILRPREIDILKNSKDIKFCISDYKR